MRKMAKRRYHKISENRRRQLYRQEEMLKETKPLVEKLQKHYSHLKLKGRKPKEE
jgi:hypothetical protein